MGRDVDASTLPGGVLRLSLEHSANWYDLTVTTTCGSADVAFSRTFMGHMETPGRASSSDPAMGAPRPKDTLEHPPVPELYRNVERWSNEKMCASRRSRHKD